MNLYSRKIVCWAMGKRMTKQLVNNALKIACKCQKTKPGQFQHSDRGVQYVKGRFAEAGTKTSK